MACLRWRSIASRTSCAPTTGAPSTGRGSLEKALTGIPKEIYYLWHDHLQAKGYKIRSQILEFQGDMPGDIGITLSWH